MDLGGGPSHDRIGFRYWKHPGPFVQYAGISGSWGRFLAFWGSLTQAAFSYIGTEVVAIAGGEAKNPRRNIPRAIKKVYIRMTLFYLCGVAIIGLLVPSTDPGLNLKSSDAAKSPFVIAIKHAGIKGLPSVRIFHSVVLYLDDLYGRAGHQRRHFDLRDVRCDQRSLQQFASDLCVPLVRIL